MKLLMILAVVAMAACGRPSLTSQDSETLEVASERFPPEFKSILQHHDRWLTHGYKFVNYDGERSINVFGPRAVNKVWAFDGKALTEVSAITLKGGKFGHASVAVDMPFSLSELQSYAPKEATGNKLVFRRLNADAFEVTQRITMEDTEVREVVVFVPYKARPSRNFASLKSMGVWKAPFGLHAGQSDDGTVAEVSIAGKETSYLHHDLNEGRQVVFDIEFPEQYKAGVLVALKKWNAALKRDYFDLNAASRPVDPSMCIAERVLCFIWNGSNTLSWSNIGGQATPMFDPLTGLVGGGVITYRNFNGDGLMATPNDIIAKMQRGFSVDDVADIFLKADEMTQYRHPQPEKLVESIASHEVGHYMGFEHYFAGSLSGTAEMPSSTVMDYSPFAIKHVHTELGPRDLKIIKAIYEDGETFEEARCNDVSISPFCSHNDLGDPAEWYMTLSRLDPDGVMAPLLMPMHLSIKYADALEQLERFLAPFKSSSGIPTPDNDAAFMQRVADKPYHPTPSQARTVRDFLCRQTGNLTAIRQRFAEESKFNLICAP